MTSVSSTFAPELWLLIASSLCQRDLACLCLTSSRLLSIFRYILYRSVKLKGGLHESNAGPALSLLTRDQALAKCVIELTLDRNLYSPNRVPMPRTGPSFVNLDALTNMTSLKRITFCGPIFLNALEQSEFGRVLSAKSRSTLEDLTYIAHADSELWPDASLGGIYDLKKIVWKAKDESTLSPMWDILSGSRRTIETLSLPFCVASQSSYLRLWNSHFPHLRSLALGLWGVDTMPEAGAGAPDFTDFILAHSDTIEELDMEYGEYDDYALSFDSSSLTRLRTDSLPHLHTFRGNASTFMVMAQARMRCLTTTLRRLVVGPGGVDAPTYELQWMFDAILIADGVGHGQPLGSLSALRELDLDISQWEEDQRDEIKESIRQCARICGPSLEVWRGTLPSSVEMDVEELGELFGAFEKLRVIHLDARIIPAMNTATTDTEEDDESGGCIRSLASKCLALKSVFVRRMIPRKSEWWEITRTSSQVASGGGQICEVKRCPIEINGF